MAWCGGAQQAYRSVAWWSGSPVGLRGKGLVGWWGGSLLGLLDGSLAGQGLGRPVGPRPGELAGWRSGVAAVWWDAEWGPGRAAAQQVCGVEVWWACRAEVWWAAAQLFL
jgi:hypothetical protein